MSRSEEEEEPNGTASGSASTSEENDAQDSSTYKRKDKANPTETSVTADSEERQKVDQAETNDQTDVNKHPLQYTYSIWFNRRVQGARTQENYEKNIKKVGTFSSVEDFWDYYSHLIRPNDLPNTSDYHLFKDGIKPMWEDEANRNGGKWILRLRKGLASKYWEDLILAVLGEQFDVGPEICGAVISIRYQEDILSLWNRTATDAETKMKILETMKRVLSLDGSARLEYKNHDASIRDNSSFRNTELVPLYMGRDRDRNRDRDRDRDRDKDRIRGRDRERDHDRERDVDRYRDLDRDRDSDKEGSRDGPPSPTFLPRDKRDRAFDRERDPKDRERRLFLPDKNIGDRRPFPKKIRGPPIHQPK
jgi:translation initiation factor 4E